MNAKTAPTVSIHHVARRLGVSYRVARHLLADAGATFVTDRYYGTERADRATADALISLHVY